MTVGELEARLRTAVMEQRRTDCRIAGRLLEDLLSVTPDGAKRDALKIARSAIAEAYLDATK